MIIKRVNMGRMRRLTKDERSEYPKMKYIVCDECTFEIDDKRIVIPRGYLTNGANWAPDTGFSWVAHDFLYSMQSFEDGSACSRKIADQIMYEILRFENHQFYAFIFKMATKIAPCFFRRSWDRGDENGPEMAEHLVS